LVLLLFRGTASIFSRAQKWLYGLVSAIVLAFAVFNVPATSFLYPVYEIDRTPLSSVGTYVLPWIAIAFALCVAVEAVRTGFTIKSNRRFAKSDSKTVL